MKIWAVSRIDGLDTDSTGLQMRLVLLKVDISRNWDEETAGYFGPHRGVSPVKLKLKGKEDWKIEDGTHTRRRLLYGIVGRGKVGG